MTQPEPIIGDPSVTTAGTPTPLPVTEVNPAQILAMLIADGGEQTYIYYLTQALTALRNGGPSQDAPDGN